MAGRYTQQIYRRKGEWLELVVNEADWRGLFGEEQAKAAVENAGEWNEGEEDRRRIGDWLSGTLGLPLSGKLLRKLLQPGAPAVGGSRAGGEAGRPGRWSSQGVQLAGGRLRLRLFPAADAGFPAEWPEAQALYVDDFCLAAAKPPGMKVHPGKPGETGTLAHAVAAHYASAGEACAVRHIHRLDEDTTGPVLYAKNEQAQHILDEAMRSKQVDRTYAALASGRISSSTGILDWPIGRDRHHGSRRRVSVGGEAATTLYEVVERYKDATLVRLRLLTGRTHQIRVHLSHMGHPLLGDQLYGGPRTGRFARQALHGEALEFPHPWNGLPVRVEMPWPDDFRQLAEELQRLTFN